MKVYRYLIGDTIQKGFAGVIQQSENFHIENYPLIHVSPNGRVEFKNWLPGTRLLEYQSGAFGKPVMILSGGLRQSRLHHWNEYVALEINDASEVPAANIFSASEEDDFWMSEEEYAAVQYGALPDDISWKVNRNLYGAWDEEEPDELWLKTLLFHYWQDASSRAFAKESKTVHVYLGQYSQSRVEEINHTIAQGKRFFAKFIDEKLPGQVRNIVSMAAGVDCGDKLVDYAALQFDITANRPAEDCFELKQSRIPQALRLDEAQSEFMDLVLQGKRPALLDALFENYQRIESKQDEPVTTTPFMADMRLWYDLYCLEMCVKEGHAFVVKARLNEREQRIKRDATDARAYYVLLKDIRSHCLNHEMLRRRVGDKKTDLVELMLEDIQAPLTQKMLEDQHSFLFMLDEMEELHRNFVQKATDKERDVLQKLVLMDQKYADAPAYIRACVCIPIQDDVVDQRCAGLIEPLLNQSFHPLIEADCAKVRQAKKISDLLNPYLGFLGTEVVRWSSESSQKRVRSVIENFLQEESKRPEAFLLLYRQVLCAYFKGSELLQRLIDQLNQKIAQTDETRFPITVQERNILHAALKEIPGSGRELDEFYACWLRRYGKNILKIQSEEIQKTQKGEESDAGFLSIVNLLGFAADQEGKARFTTSGALRILFTEAAERGRQEGISTISPEEACAYFQTFFLQGNAALPKDTQDAFQGMVKACFEREIEGWESASPDALLPMDWLLRMQDAALHEGKFELQNADILLSVFQAASKKTEKHKGDQKAILQIMPPHQARDVFSALNAGEQSTENDPIYKEFLNFLTCVCDLEMEIWEKQNAPDAWPIAWLREMIQSARECAGYRVNTYSLLCCVLKHAAGKGDLTRSEAHEIFDTLGKKEGGYAQNDEVSQRFSEILNESGQALLNAGETPIHHLKELLNAFPGDTKPDASQILCKILQKAGESNTRPDVNQIREAFGLCDPIPADRCSEIRNAYSDMLNCQAQKAFAASDYSVAEWLDGMYKWGENVFPDEEKLNPFANLRGLFSAEGCMPPSAAKVAFGGMYGSVTDQQKDSILDNFHGMLREQIGHSSDPRQTFDWLQEMLQNAPNEGKEDDRISTTHDIMIERICGDKNAPIDRMMMKTVSEWVKAGGVRERSKNTIQNYLNDRIAQSDPQAEETANDLVPKLGRISSSDAALWDYWIGHSLKQMMDKIPTCDPQTYADVLRNMSRDLADCGISLDKVHARLDEEKHRQDREEYDGQVRRMTDSTLDMGLLRQVEGKIPAGQFQTEWRNAILQKTEEKQEELFRECKTLEECKALRQEVFARQGISQQKTLTAAYDILIQYGTDIETIKSGSGLDGLSALPQMMEKQLRNLSETGSLCAHLCWLIGAQADENIREMRQKGFRHGVAGLVYYSLFNEKGSIAWENVLKKVLPVQTASAASAKPYAAKNLPVLQKLLALLDAVQSMNRDEMQKAALEACNHLYSVYISSLRRNTKQSEHYGLHFDQRGHLDY